MSFQYRELAMQVQAPGLDPEEYTCTGWTKPTGCVAASEVAVAEQQTGHLAYLKQQLRQAVEQA